MGITKLSETEVALRAAEKAKEAAAAAEADRKAELNKLFEDSQEIGLPKALKVLNSSVYNQLGKRQQSRIRKPILDAIIDSELLRERAVFVSGIPAGEQEQSIAMGVAGRSRKYRCLNVEELKNFNPVITKPETIIVYGFPTQKDRVDDAAHIVLTALQGLEKAREKEDNKGRMIVLSNKKLDVSGSPKAAELAQKFKFGHLTEKGVRAY